MELLTALGLAIPAGLNAYIPLLAVAIAQRMEWIALEAPFSFLGEWWAIALITVLLVIEIIADKVPAVDHANDVLQTFVRPAAAAIIAAAAAAGNDYVHPAVLVVVAILLAGGVHAVKASVRPAVNVTTGGAGAPVVSTAEDIAAVLMSVLAFVVPLLLMLSALGVAIWAALRWNRRRTDRPTA